METEYTGVVIKKLYNGLAEIRDYQLEKIIKRGRGIKFILDDQEKYVPMENISKGKKGNNITAKFPLPNGSVSYRLIGYNWDELLDAPEQNAQMELL